MPEIDDATFKRVFQGNSDGEAVLETLAAAFVYTPVFSTDPLEMAKLAGKQELVLDIMRRSAE